MGSDRAQRESCDEKHYHDEMVATPQKQYQKLQDRIDAMYLDKLDGRVSEDFFDRKNEEWRAEQAEMRRKIEKHRNANHSYIDDGVRLLELAQKAADLYDRQEMREKCRILVFVFSNSTWKDGRLTPNYRKSFDMLALTNATYQKEKATSPKKDRLFEIWLPELDEFHSFFMTECPNFSPIRRD